MLSGDGSTGEYVFEWDLKDVDISKTTVDSPSFSEEGNTLFIKLEKGHGQTKYKSFTSDVKTPFLFPGLIYCQFDLVSRLDNQIVLSRVIQSVYYKTDDIGGVWDWIDPETIRDHILKVKISPERTLSDFMENLSSCDHGFLGEISPTLLSDLERLYISAVLYQIAGLCDSILKYLEFLINERTFGEIYLIAKRIDSKSLESYVYRSWFSNSVEFNKNDGQIDVLIQGERADQAGEIDDCEAVIRISRKIVKASEWSGMKDSQMSVILCLTKLLNIEGEARYLSFLLIYS
jgi:hypothetical protein